jgi:hypothetical protein
VLRAAHACDGSAEQKVQAARDRAKAVQASAAAHAAKLVREQKITEQHAAVRIRTATLFSEAACAWMQVVLQTDAFPATAALFYDDSGEGHSQDQAQGQRQGGAQN